MTTLTHAKTSATPVEFVSKFGDGRSMTRIARTEWEVVSTEVETSDVTDAKGRQLGHRVVIVREVTAYGTEEANRLWDTDKLDEIIGETFVVEPHSMRGGQSYGACQTGKRVRTMAEAVALSKSIFDKARKSAAGKVARQAR